MPLSNRRTRSQRGPGQDEPAEMDTPESIPTPSRKRRRLEGNSGNRSVTSAATQSANLPRTFSLPEDADNTGTKDVDLLEGGPLTPDKVVLIIQSLRKPNYVTQASIDHANEVHFRDNPNARPAYAKISGRDWTYFVNKKRVIIGRPVEAGQRASAEVRESGSPVAAHPSATFEVDIDLGPDKMVSRVHAEIFFDSDTFNWIILVNGRNGIYVDDMKLSRGSRAVLHSGSVINVHESQMMFLTADSEVVVHDMFRKQAWMEQHDASEEEGDDDTNFKSSKSQRLEARNASASVSRPAPGTSQQRGPDAAQQLAWAQSTAAPATPSAKQPATPSSVKGKDGHQKVKQSPSTIKGMMLESTEEIDYSVDSARDLKPPRSYASLIGQAIMASEEQKLTLAKIYDFIKQHYAYYRLSSNIGWQNSIRHNLSLNKCFEKVARRTDEPGKGMKWQIVPEYREEFVSKGFTNHRKLANRPGSSDPSSPAFKEAASAQATERLMGVLGEGRNATLHTEKVVKTSPRSVTPPISSFPIANESYTPDRGPRPLALKFERGGANGVFDHNTRTPLIRRSHGDHFDPAQPTLSANSAIKGKLTYRGLTEAAAMSPPTLSSSMYADEGQHGSHALETPLVPRQQPRLAPPSAAHLPSHFMLFSSPAPFWKFADLGSTPARPPPLDLSPTKSMAGQDPDSGPQSSSPPLADGLGIGREVEQSPTRTLSRPASRRDGPSLPLAQPVVGTASGLGPVDEDDEGEIDLAKGFQKIGSFHSHRNLAGLSGEIRGV